MGGATAPSLNQAVEAVAFEGAPARCLGSFARGIKVAWA